MAEREIEAFNLKEFDDMKEDEIFQVSLSSIGASYEFVNDLLMPFGNNVYAGAYGNIDPKKTRVTFIRTKHPSEVLGPDHEHLGDVEETCIEAVTGTVFRKERDGLYSEETGLYFMTDCPFITISTKRMVEVLRTKGYADHMERFFGHFEKLQKRDSYLRGIMYKMALEEGKTLDYEAIQEEKEKTRKVIKMI